MTLSRPPEAGARTGGSARGPADIAVVGAGCRFPGGVRDLPSLWNLLLNGVDVIDDVPADRWSGDYHSSDPEQAGTTYCRVGGFLEDVDRFDAEFFRISPREARDMDPQQRILLEVAWEAVEDAGLTRTALDGSETGVYLGILGMDYTVLHAKTLGAPAIGPYFATGKEFSFGSGRISYTLGLHGPSMTVNTACSSSLVATHLACQSLLTGESDIALVGGVNVVASPELSIFLSKARAMSPTGRCRPFDAAADGIVRGEGCGVVVLKRLRDAVESGDRVLGVILGSATNHDGRSAGLTVPNTAAQEALIRRAVRAAGVDPSDVAYVEAHGTGTPLGDPIELGALGATLGAERETPLVVGSLKANFGHMDSAAGIAGLLKALLVVRHRTAPPQLHLTEPNPRVPWTDLGLTTPRTRTPLGVEGRPLVAGVSAFGLSGTNAHLILRDPPDSTRTHAKPTDSGMEPARDSVELGRDGVEPARDGAEPGRGGVETGRDGAELAWDGVESGRDGPAPGRDGAAPARDKVEPGRDGLEPGRYGGVPGRGGAADGRTRILVMSASSAETLRARVAAFHDLLGRDDAPPVDDLAYTAAVRRTHHAFRLAVCGDSREAFAEGLAAHLAGERHPAVHQGDVEDQVPPPVVFAFSGQGSQWPGMGADLYATEPSVRETLDECDALFREHATGWSLLNELRDTGESRLAETEIAQPAIFALQLALARLWRARGVEPAAVVGHSMGEVAAACFAGALALPDAARLIVHRGRLMRAARGSGRMAAVECSPGEAREVLDAYGGVCVAAVNGPRTIVIAGDAGQVAAAVTDLGKAGRTCTPLPVDHAFHSPAVHRYGDELETLLDGLATAEPYVPLLSSVDPEAENPALDPAYWGRNVREPVRFWPAVDRWLAQRDAAFVEIGPHPVLSRPLAAALLHRDRDAPVVASLRRGRPGAETMAAATAKLHVGGVPIAWDRLCEGRLTALPVHAWAGSRYWLPGVDRGRQTSYQDGHQSSHQDGHQSDQQDGGQGSRGNGHHGGRQAGGQGSQESGWQGGRESGHRHGWQGVHQGGGQGSRESGHQTGWQSGLLDASRLRAEVRLVDENGRTVAEFGGGADSLRGAASSLSGGAGALLGGVLAANGPEQDDRNEPGHAAAPRPEPAGSARERLCTLIQTTLADLLEWEPGTRVPRTRGFYDLGLDSVATMELAKRLSADLGHELSAAELFDHPSVNELARHILDVAPGTASRTGTTTAPAREPEATIARAGESANAASPGPVPGESVPGESVSKGRVPGGPEPIAIVGIGCRFPKAASPDGYWSLLRSGVDASTDLPEGRWDADAFPVAGDGRPGAVATRRGSFIEHIDEFDNAFFRISAREARSLDPQQRLFMEVAWEALQDAGIVVEHIRGGRTGVFVGLNTTDYQQLVTRDPENIDLYYGTGNSFSGAAGRLSYFLGVRGPSIAVDTACSSSLTAVHLACQSLASAESDIAVAGGANVMATPTVYLSMSSGALAADGRCKTFDDSADGYGRGEGAGVVVLKRLSTAVEDGDRIYAVIRGTAVNQDGASGGLTVPSGEAQREVIATALARARLTPAEVDYVEAHGTGTHLGDAIELRALDGALGAGRDPSRPLLVGSAKTNIGHLEAAAGMAGLIKVVLAMRHGEIPPHLHLATPTTQVPWDRLRLRVPTERTEWARQGHTRTAGVSAFGFTGTNAHVIVQEYDDEDAKRPQSDDAVWAQGGGLGWAQDADAGRVQGAGTGWPQSGGVGQVQDAGAGRVQGAATGRVQDADARWMRGGGVGRVRGAGVGWVRGEDARRVQSEDTGWPEGEGVGWPDGEDTGRARGDDAGRVRGEGLGRPACSGPYALPLSAATPTALRDVAGRMADRLEGAEGDAVADVCYTAGARRTHLQHRLAVVAGSPRQLVRRLRAVADGHRPRGCHVASGPVAEPRLLAFAYGDTAGDLPWEYLLENAPEFADAVRECDEVMRAVLGVSPLAEMRAGASAATAVARHVGLTALWRRWSVRPEAAVGYGAGELSAAWAAGALSLAQVAEVLAGRDPAGTREPDLPLFSASAGPRVTAEGVRGRVTDPAARARIPAADLAQDGLGLLVLVGLDAPGGLPVVRGPSGAAAPEDWAAAAAQAYASGAAVDWERVSGGRRRVVSLPNYPWERRRHWIDVPFTPAAPPRAEEPMPLRAGELGHPRAKGEVDRRDRNLMEDGGLTPPTAADAREAPDHLARTGVPSATVAAADEAAYVQLCQTRAPRTFLSGLAAAGGDGSGTPLARELLALPEAEREDRLTEELLAVVGAVLRDDADIAPDKGFFELGMDSVMSLNLKTRVERALGCELPTTLTFEFPTTAALVRHLLTEALGSGETPEAPPPETPSPGPAEPEAPERDPAGREAAGTETAGTEAAKPEVAEREMAGPEAAGSEAAGCDPAAPDAAGPGAARPEPSAERLDDDELLSRLDAALARSKSILGD